MPGDLNDTIAHDTYIENFVSVGTTAPDGGVGFWSRGSISTLCVNCSFLNGGPLSDGALADDRGYVPVSSVFFTNTLSYNNPGRGFYITGQTSWGIEYSNAYNNGTDYAQGTGLSSDPRLGACRVFIPDSSPMKRAGKDGADIGANVLYVYENGALTNKPLWKPTEPNKGMFPCGAIVRGVNDIAGQSCFDVHVRLNVNSNGCNLPAGYTGEWPPRPIDGSPSHVYTLTTSKPVYAPGERISVSWSISPGPGNPKDWIGFYLFSETDNMKYIPTDGAGSQAWTYTGGQNSGTFTITAPSTRGIYGFRYLLDDGYRDVKRSEVITVTASTGENPAPPGRLRIIQP